MSPSKDDVAIQIIQSKEMSELPERCCFPDMDREDEFFCRNLRPGTALCQQIVADYCRTNPSAPQCQRLGGPARPNQTNAWPIVLLLLLLFVLIYWHGFGCY